MLWFTITICLLIVHTRQGMEGITGNHNQSTRDGTKVVVRAAGTGMEAPRNAEKSGQKSDQCEALPSETGVPRTASVLETPRLTARRPSRDQA